MKDFIYGLTSQDMVEIDRAFRTLENILGGFCISLTDAERSATPALADRRLSFTLKAFDYAKRYPDLLPANRSLSNLMRVHSDWVRLVALLRRMSTIAQMLDDAVMVVGATFYAYARVFYAAVQENLHDDIGGLRTVQMELSVQFEVSGTNLDDEAFVDSDLTPSDGGDGNLANTTVA